MSDLRHILFPEPPRMFPGRRIIRSLLRAAHVAASAVLLGGHFVDGPLERLVPFLWVALATGALLIVTELLSTFAWLFEVRGLFILLKIALLSLILILWESRAAILLIILLLSVVVAHASGSIRHRLVFFRGTIRPTRGND
ncbi:MAG: hypothetical protein HYY84_19735 [Deltaproteobacteria bacterium]|nr:hypothetical protein [Deltaproteobacteria bacterium]